MTSRFDWRTANALAGLAMAFGAAPALAGDNVFDPSLSAFSNVQGSPNSSSVEIKNGVVVPNSTAGVFTAGASPDGFVNSTSASSNAGNTSHASADYRRGSVRASVVVGNVENAARGFAEARIKDTVFFNNTSAGNVVLPISFSFDGSISDPRNFGSNVQGIFTLAGGLSECPGGGFGTCFGDYGLKFQSGVAASQTLVIGYAGNGTFNGVQQGGAFFFNAPDNIDSDTFSVFKDWASIPDYYNTVVSTALVLPTGRSRIGVDLRVVLDCSQVGSICDFGQTGKFGFGALPQGLTFTSASGALLTPAAVGGVPEPASWAMLIAGFGLVGAAMRKRRMAGVAA